MSSVCLATMLSVLLFTTSCHKSKTSRCNEPDLDCSRILCFTQNDYFEFTLVDKVSAEDLLFSSNPRYTISDIKLFKDAARTQPLSITADNINKKIQCNTNSTEMYLEIKGVTVYKLNAAFKRTDCCTSRIKSLEINNNPLCTCCSDIINIPVN